MKPYLFFLLLIHFTITSYTQIIYEDFDGGVAQLTWEAIDGTYFGPVSNPDNTGENTSPDVGAYKKGPQPYSLFLTNLAVPMDLSVNNSFSLQIYSPVPSAIILKLEPSGGGTAYEEFETITAINEWKTYTFDFTAASAATNLDRIILFFNPGVMDNEDTYHFDNLIASSTVPVELIRFEATQNDDLVELVWETAAEVNNNYFEIEHSMNGIDFKTVGKVQAKTQNQDLHVYTYDYLMQIAGHHFFRLKQVDLDGSTTTFSTIKIDFQTSNLRIFPNPVANYLTIQGEKAGSKISIINSEGRLVRTVELQNDIQSVDLTDLSPGKYTISNMMSGSSIRFVKE